MSIAVITYTYNEGINLPIWVNHYKKGVGVENLFVIDRSSTDGSVDNLPGVNIIKVPWTPFDDTKKTRTMNDMHSALLGAYDTVIVTDCDELLVADPGQYDGLADYVNSTDFDCMNAVGLEVQHLLDEEYPIDFSKSLLSQRSHARFQSPSCKNLLSRIPLRWLNGFHSCDKLPRFDKKLFMFHIKVIDYGTALNRQKVNRETAWSEDAIMRIPDTHHKYTNAQFFHQNFLVPMDIVKRGDVFDEEAFEDDLQIIKDRTELHNGFFYIPMDIRRMVKIPERFKKCF